MQAISMLILLIENDDDFLVCGGEGSNYVG